MTHLAEKRYGDGTVLALVDDLVGAIELHRPEVGNALNAAMWRGLGDALDGFAANDDVRVVVLTGAGHVAFSTGMDQTAASPGELPPDLAPSVQEGLARVHGFPKPLIARIRGHCYGAGLALALAADLRIAARDSDFAMPGASLGIGPGFAAVERLVQTVGHAAARHMILTSRPIDSARALHMGLVDQVVPDEDLSMVVVDLARGIADNAPLALRAAKFAVEQCLRDPAARDMAELERLRQASLDSADYREGLAALKGKRAPRFAGR